MSDSPPPLASPDPRTVEIQELQERLVDAWMEGRLTFTSFNRLLTSATTMSIRLEYVSIETDNARADRALERLRQAAAACRPGVLE